MKVVIINGKPTVGKDQFVTYCQKYARWCGNYSTVSVVKDIAFELGWNGEKTPKDRKFLSDLKDLLTEWKDIPFNSTIQYIKGFCAEAEMWDYSSDDVIVFVHCREPEEIARFCKEIGAISLLIRRPSVECKEQSNHADDQVFQYDYDYTIYNDGTLDELEQKAIAFLNEMGYKNNLIIF